MTKWLISPVEYNVFYDDYFEVRKALKLLTLFSMLCTPFRTREYLKPPIFRPFQKNPLLISRNCLQSEYNGGFLSSNDIMKLIRTR